MGKCNHPSRWVVIRGSRRDRRWILRRAAVAGAAALAGLALATAGARAGTQYFDVNGTAAGSGITATNEGPFSFTGNYWSADNSGVSATSGFASGSVVFVATGDAGTLPFTVNVPGTVNLASLTLNSGNLTLTGSNSNFYLNAAGVWTIGAGLTLTNQVDAALGSFGLNLNGNTLTVAGAGNLVMTGPLNNGGAVVMNGTGTLALQGADGGQNTFSTTINSGAVSLQSNGATGNAGNASGMSSITVNSGGALQLQGGITTATAVPLSLTGTGVAASPNGALENVSGSNTYTGAITLAGNATIGSDSGGTLSLNSATAIGGSGYGLTLAGAGNGTIASAIATGAGPVTKTGAGTWTLGGANTYTGATNVNTGTLALGASGSLASSTINVASGATFDVTALGGSSITLAASQTLAGAGTVNGGVSVGSGIVAPGSSSAVGNLTVTGGLTTASGSSLNFFRTPSGNSQLTVSASNGLTINGGTLNFDALGSTAPVTAPGQYNLIAFSGTIGGLGASSLTLPSVSGVTYTLVNTGSGFLQLDVSGGLVWSGATNGNWSTASTDKNWYDGSTSTAVFANGKPVTFQDTANGATVTNSNVTIAAGGVQPSTVAFLNSAVPYTLNSADAVGIAGSTGVAVSGGGTVTMLGANTYTGATAVGSGVLNIQNAGALGTTSGVTVSSGAALQMQGGITTTTAVPLGLAGAGASGNGALESVSGNNTYSGAVTLAGATTIGSDSSAGLLTLSNTTAITGAGFGLTLTGAGNGAIAAAITTGGGAVTKNGAGSWTLNGANTYTGATTVNAGTLVFTAAPAASSSIVINSPGILNYNLSSGKTQGATTITGNGELLLSGASQITLGNSGNVNVSLGAGGLIDVTAGSVVSSSSYQGIWTNNKASLAVASTAVFYTKENVVNVDALTGSGTINQNYSGPGIVVGDANGSGAFSGVMQDGSGGPLAFTKTGSGTESLSGANTYSGGSTLAGGVVQIGSNKNPIPASGSVSFAGGTLNSNGYADSMGPLKITSGSSVLQFGASGDSGNILTFTGTPTYTAGNLVVTNWDGLTSGGGNDQFIVSVDPSTVSGLLGSITFQNPAGFGPGSYPASDVPVSGGFEIVPTPEPGSIALLTLGAAGLLIRRRRRALSRA